jgi:hypothetical protein
MIIQDKVKSSLHDSESEYGKESTIASFTASNSSIPKKHCNCYDTKITSEAASADSEEAL